MTNQHPLTDELLQQIDIANPRARVFDTQAMRAAADWQLEQAVEWLRNNLDESYVYVEFDDGDVLAPGIDVESVIDDIKKTMRSTQENN